MRDLTDACTQEDKHIKALQKELSMHKSDLSMLLELYGMKAVEGKTGSLKVGVQHRFKCWADNKVKIMQLPEKLRTDLCVPDFKGIKEAVKAGQLDKSILDDALYSDVTTLTFKEAKV